MKAEKALSHGAFAALCCVTRPAVDKAVKTGRAEEDEDGKVIPSRPANLFYRENCLQREIDRQLLEDRLLPGWAALYVQGDDGGRMWLVLYPPHSEDGLFEGLPVNDAERWRFDLERKPCAVGVDTEGNAHQLFIAYGKPAPAWLKSSLEAAPARKRKAARARARRTTRARNASASSPHGLRRGGAGGGL